ncbi:MCE family protein [Nocardioides sp.]|uniref:MCE family protein n=1 Tax=Nocardioides sp. TaxID=35761 RepID=UPI0031FF3AB5|nr:mce related protein [Nocardioides sp.]
MLTSLGSRVNGRTLAVLAAVVALTATFFLVRSPAETKTVTAHFTRAVSVYKGTDVRILGVNVGTVTAVIPEGESVRVEMEYDAKYSLPADAKAVVVTPTLVADRFVQLTPAYTEGKVLADGAEIALPDTGVPVELDRIYASLRDLSEALGPNGVNKDGSLNHLLKAGAGALEGQGKLGNEMLTNLSQAAVTFGQGSGDLFATVSDLAQFTSTLAANDRLVRAFIKDLAGVSSSLVSERTELQQALASVASAVGTVKTFVQDNRTALVTDVEKLTRVMKTINSEKDSIDTALQIAPVAIGNLSLAYNSKSGTIGSRIGIQGQLWDADGFLCAVVQQSSLPRASANLACQIFKQLLQPLENQIPAIPSGKQQSPPKADAASLARRTESRYAVNDSATLDALLGGGQ